MSGRRLVTALLAMMLGAAVLSVLPDRPAASADPALSDSAMTKSGTGDFKNLKVTVSQTKNLINQVITISWTGGVPTAPAGGAFSLNYLQIMQCWGDSPDGPDRTQCQYGGSYTQSAPAAGTWVRSRQVQYGTALVDPEEKLTLPPGTFGSARVPFWAAGKDPPPVTSSDDNDFFDSQVTNEIPLARTHGDGTGLEYFEVETVRQAAGLGCGDPVPVGGVTKARSCWLVVVPRGSTEVDGSPRQATGAGLQSSPLSQTNWDKRIFFPLDFLPVGQACPIGSPERRVIGNEVASDAVSSWQAVLCQNGGALYSYTQLSDDVSRSQVLDGSSPGLALITNPIPPDQAPPGRPLVYAPVGLSGLAIAFNIEHQPPVDAPPDMLQLDGQRFTSMKLNARLVAKLLTQSYRHSVTGSPDYLKNNPNGLTVDPEFLKLNPDYTGFASAVTPPDALVQLGGADVTLQLWSWIKADPAASAFIAGQKDDWGMVVNPNNQNLTLPVSMFPRNDQSCVDANVGLGVMGRLCTLDEHPFTTDMHDAGRSASRGDSQARTVVLGNDLKTPTTKKVDRQAPGQRALLAVVDTATAARYGLSVAALQNSAGQFVTPSPASLQAGEAAMKPSAVGEVLAPNPGTTDPAAYPLTTLSYAAATPSTLTVAAGKDYATFLRYVAGPGQQPGIEPGQLPPGMAPLPEALKKQTSTAAATIEAQAGKGPSGQPGSQAAAAASGANSGLQSIGNSSGSAGTNVTTSPGGNSGVPSPAGPAGAGNPSAQTPNVVQQPVAGVRRTPALPAPAWIGGSLLAILLCGGLAATSSPALQSSALHRLGAEVRRRVRREVKQTEP
jgi:hypothetical protein